MEKRFIDIVEEIQEVIREGYLIQDPNDANRILLFRQPKNAKGGWYSENILDVASELLHDEKNYQNFCDAIENVRTKNKQVLDFIRRFHSHTQRVVDDGYNQVRMETLREQFAAGYCYHFAHILQATFRRGEVMWAAPFGHIVWMDETGVTYDIDGEYKGEAELIPIRYIQEHINNFTREDIAEQEGATQEYIENAIQKYHEDIQNQKEREEFE